MYGLLKSFLFHLDAERAHNLGTAAARVGQRIAPGMITRRFGHESPRLGVEAFGLTFDNPLGIAAGFDKNARLVPFWRQLGCGFAEIGSVTAKSCRGNRRPRAFRLPDDEALVNRMGLNNQGARRIAKRIASLAPHPLPLAVSLAKTHDPAVMGEAALEDFDVSFRACAGLADLIVLNLSCPNTAEGKTFEDPNTLDDLLHRIMVSRAELGLAVPVLLKLSPPVSPRFVLDSEVDEILSVSRAHDVAGFVAANTDPSRDGLVSDAGLIERIGAGGLSGRPLRDGSMALVRYLYRKTGGSMPIIGVGGIFSGQDAYERIRAGASLVQLYTAMVYRGPGVFRDIKVELDRLLEKDGYSSVADAVGVDA